jgi:putative transposase
MGTLKEKIAIKLFKTYPTMKKKPYWGNHIWARGYFVNTVGLDEEMIKRYVKHQEKEEKQIKDQQQNFDF